MSRKKELRPIWTTTVQPWEYNYQAQFAEAVKISNRLKETFVSMDIGKVWGLVQNHARLERENAALREENAEWREMIREAVFDNNDILYWIRGARSVLLDEVEKDYAATDAARAKETKP